MRIREECAKQMYKNFKKYFPRALQQEEEEVGEARELVRHAKSATRRISISNIPAQCYANSVSNTR